MKEHVCVFPHAITEDICEDILELGSESDTCQVLDQLPKALDSHLYRTILTYLQAYKKHVLVGMGSKSNNTHLSQLSVPLGCTHFRLQSYAAQEEDYLLNGYPHVLSRYNELIFVLCVCPTTLSFGKEPYVTYAPGTLLLFPYHSDYAYRCRIPKLSDHHVVVGEIHTI